MFNNRNPESCPFLRVPAALSFSAVHIGLGGNDGWGREVARAQPALPTESRDRQQSLELPAELFIWQGRQRVADDCKAKL